MKLSAYHLSRLTLCALLATPFTALASCLDNVRLTGVNIAGAEFNSGRLPGVPDKDYAYPKEAELTYIAEQGANIIRLPFRWERVQPKAHGALDPNELKRLQQTVKFANSKGLCVILDVHNYAKYYNQVMNDNTDLQDAFVDLWLRLGAAFTDPTSTAFGLMNEPNYLSNAQWATLAKRTLGKLRKANSKNLVLIAGGHWSGLHDWFTERDGVSNASAFADLNDPLKRTILEVHQYADQNYSGTGTDCRPADDFNAKFDSISAWANKHGQRLFLGEFGTPTSTNCLAVLERFLSLMNTSPWKGWTYWAAGGWWGNYPLALNTSDKTPSPQWPLLKKYFDHSHSNNRPKPPTPMPLADTQ